MTGPLHGPLAYWQAYDEAVDVAIYADAARVWWREAARDPRDVGCCEEWARWMMRGLWAEEALRRREMGT